MLRGAEMNKGEVEVNRGEERGRICKEVCEV